jgi:small subunit ribosomal protein S4
LAPDRFPVPSTAGASPYRGEATPRCRRFSPDSVRKKVGFPSWVEVDPKKLAGTYKGAPDRSEFGQDINESLVVELYSK